MGISIKLPTEKVDLPSNGYGYNGEIPSTLTLKMLTLADSKAMMAAGASLSSMISDILKRCIEEPIDVDRLYATDRLFLFFMLRKISFGAKLPFEFKCEECDHKNSIIRVIPDDFKLVLKEDEEFTKTIKLSVTGLKVTVRLLTGVEEKALEKKNTQDKKSFMIDRVACHITKIEQGKEEETDSIVIRRLVHELPFSEQIEIKEAIESIDFGFMTTHLLTCENCGTVQEVPVAVGQSFFRRGDA